jgi:hypothetical protein
MLQLPLIESASVFIAAVLTRRVAACLSRPVEMHAKLAGLRTVRRLSWVQSIALSLERKLIGFIAAMLSWIDEGETAGVIPTPADSSRPQWRTGPWQSR